MKTISVVIPTRDRAFSLLKVLESYFLQNSVIEIILVDDAGNDETEQVAKEISKNHPAISLLYLANEVRCGAAASRNRGVHAASGDYILFGEDDAYLEANYTEILLRKLMQTSADISSGRLVQMRPKESCQQALKRFGKGISGVEVFDFQQFKVNQDAWIDEDVCLPLTHALVLARRELFIRYPFDETYSKGNGFREESTFQAAAFLGGCVIAMTHETHCMHIHSSEVMKGGHRLSYLRKSCYTLYYHFRFLRKYYSGYASKLDLDASIVQAFFVFLVAFVKEQIEAVVLSVSKRLRKR